MKLCVCVSVLAIRFPCVSQHLWYVARCTRLSVCLCVRLYLAMLPQRLLLRQMAEFNTSDNYVLQNMILLRFRLLALIIKFMMRSNAMQL